MFRKCAVSALLAAFVFILPVAAQQTQSSDTEEEKSDSIMTVEEAYLNSAEGVIIKELAQADGRDAKQVALQYIEEAINNGRQSQEMLDALKILAGEGMLTVVRENGRVANNYPDIRRKACELLGQTGSEEAVPILISVLYVDNEPSVISAAVKALGDIGSNENDDVVEMINWIARKFDIILPTSSLALEILNTYEKLAPTVENKTGLIENIMRIASNYNYVTPVRNRAYEVLKSIHSSSGNGEGDRESSSSENSTEDAGDSQGL